MRTSLAPALRPLMPRSPQQRPTGQAGQALGWRARGSQDVIDQTLFESDVVRAGRFRLPSSHPGFESFSAPTENYLFAFPRTSVAVEQEGHRPFIADPNTIPLHNAGRHYRRQSVAGADDRCDWFAVAPAVLRDIVAEFDPGAADVETPLRFAWSRPDARTYLAQRRLYRYLCTHAEPDAIFVEESVIALAVDILDAAYRQWEPAARGSDNAARHRLVDRTRERLAQSLSENISLGALAREAGASVFHLCRVFKALTGMTIHQYRTQLRLRQSLELLEQEPRDILAAALECGFSGHSHFTRTFHAVFGLPPSAFTYEVVAGYGRQEPAS